MFRRDVVAEPCETLGEKHIGPIPAHKQTLDVSRILDHQASGPLSAERFNGGFWWGVSAA